MWIWLGFTVAGSLIVALLYLGVFQDRSRGRPRCPQCWYNMTGAPSLVCPECGHDARFQGRLFRTRRRRWPVVLAILLALGCAYAWQVRLRIAESKEPWALAFRPTWWLLMTFPSRPPAEQYDIADRISRSGVWPWDERLLMMSCNTMLTGAKRQHGVAIQLLCSAASHSRQALDRLCEFTHRDEGLRLHAAMGAATFAERLTDRQLMNLLETVPSLQRMEGLPDRLLKEMIARKRPEFRRQLARLAALPSGKPVHDLPYYVDYPPNLAFLTALRRLEGRPDPLRIALMDASPLDCRADDLPRISVSVGNVDVEQIAVGIQEGGWYCGHSPARWRLEVHDERGRPVPVRAQRANSRELSSRRLLAFGETRSLELDVDDVVGPLEPGRYRAVVRYHIERGIAYLDEGEISKLITFTSDPFELIVRPAGSGWRPAGK
ncbi:MAG: hypothetical protein AMXMBFR13_02690 [Phycisphaerae bacterium]